jgi:DNA-binding protein WhiA
VRAPLYEIELAGQAAEVASGRPPRRPAARCDRRMEIRAAFLACGSLATPAHGYHLEFVPPGAAAADRLAAILAVEGHRPKCAIRRARPVIYFKDIDAIVALLSSIGAFGAVLRLEEVRALKETKNRIRRLVNMEAANVDRAAGAAALQRDAIAFLADAYGLRKLSPPLREIAVLRMTYPSETLAELGRRCTPPVPKSTVNGRIAALARLARRLRDNRPRERGGGTKTDRAAG